MLNLRKVLQEVRMEIDEKVREELKKILPKAVYMIKEFIEKK